MARLTNRFRSQSRPNRTWAAFNTGATPVSVAASAKVLLGGFSLSSAGIDETILRTVGVVSTGTDNFHANRDVLGALGMIFVTDNAATVGITAIPGPITDASDDGWFLYVPFAQHVDSSDQTGINPNAFNQIMFDSKAKRIGQGGQQIAIVIENRGAVGIEVMVIMRMLSQVRGTH